MGRGLGDSKNAGRKSLGDGRKSEAVDLPVLSSEESQGIVNCGETDPESQSVSVQEVDIPSEIWDRLAPEELSCMRQSAPRDFLTGLEATAVERRV